MGVDDFREWITSLLFGITFGYIYMVSYYQYLLYFSVLHFVIFAATIVPIKGTFLSDGMQFLILIKDDEKRSSIYITFKYQVSYLVIRGRKIGIRD